MDNADYGPDSTDFTWGLESPSKFVEGAHGQFPGLTPSLFGHGGARGFTPSGFTPSVFGTTAADPPSYDYFSLDATSRSNADTEERARAHTQADADAHINENDKDNAESTFLAFGFRKRALSSPAIFMDGSSVVAANSAYHSNNARWEAHAASKSSSFEPVLKRPRLYTDMSFSSGSGSGIGSGSGSYNPGSFTTTVMTTDESPMSSLVLTPPDSAAATAHLPVISDTFSLDMGMGASKQPPPPLPQLLPPTIEPPRAELPPAIPLSRISSARAPAPLPSPTSLPHATYKSFGLPTDMTATYQPFLYEVEAEERVAAQQQQRQQAKAGGASPNKGRKSAGTASASSAKGKKAAAAASVGSEVDELDEDARGQKKADDGEEEEEDTRTVAEKDADRKLFLERNRLAASKSRRKKKEKVNSLETTAREIGERNSALQTVALSLRRELASLRQDLERHDGCDCEHVKGYLAREANGGGIPTIDALAGRVMQLDYANVPTLGSDHDLYRGIFVPDEEAAKLLAAASKKSTVSTRKPSASAGAASSTSTATIAKTKAKRMSTAAAVKTVVEVPEPGVAPKIRRASAAADVALTPNGSSLSPFEAAVMNRQLPGPNKLPPPRFAKGAPIPTRQSQPVIEAAPSDFDFDFAALPPLPMPNAGPVQDLFVRSSSAPPTTPNWDVKVGSGLTGDSYF